MDVDDVAQRLMDAAVDPTLWTLAMDSAAQYANAYGATILPVRGRLAIAPLSQSMSEIFKDYVNDGWYLRDERERGLVIMRERGIFTDQDFASREELSSSDYYRGFLARHSFNWAAGVGIKTGGDEFCLMLGRGDKEGHFDQAEQEKILRLIAPLQQAALVGSHLNFGKVVGLSDAFDMIGCASILLDRFGKVFRVNKSAEQYLGDGLSISSNDISCAFPADTAALRRMIFSCCVESKFNEIDVARSLVVQRPSKQPLIIQVVRLLGMVGDIFSQAKVLLFIIDSDQAKDIAPPDEIQKTFRLSAAEVALLLVLEREIPLPQAAERLGISYETARSQLKSMFHKTETKRQSELLALIRRLTPRIR